MPFAAFLVGLGLLLTAAPAHASSALRIGKVQYDSPGTDTRSAASLDAEYVVITNAGSSNRSLTGFTVRDAQRHVYRFGAFVLKAGRSVRLHTGSGADSATDRYWGSRAYIWNNTGDKVTVRSRAGTTLDSCSWSRDGVGHTYC